MVSKVAGVHQPLAALVIDSDPTARQRICQVLQNKGIEVSACACLAEGRDQFEAHGIVMARAPQEGRLELNGFVDWIRERSGEWQPCIVAIDDSRDSEEIDMMEAASANPGCDAVLPSSLDERQLEERLGFIDQWLATRSRESDGLGATVALPAQPQMPIPIRKVPGEVALGAADADISRAAPVETPAPVEEAVFGSNAHASILIENAPLAMAMFDTEMRYLIANRRWHKEFHLENTSLAGRSHFEIFPRISEDWKRIYSRCLQEGKVDRCEEDLFERPDGTTDWVRWEVRPWKKADGAVGGLIISSEVITPLRVRQRSSEFDAEFTGSVLHNGTVPVMVVDLSGRILRCNPPCEVLFHQSGRHAEKALFWDLMAADENQEQEKARFAQAIEVLKHTGHFDFPAHSVHRIPGANGASRRVAWANTPQLNEKGTVEGLIRIGIELPPDPAAAPAILPPMSPAAQPVPVQDAPPEGWKNREGALLQERDIYLKIAQNSPFGIILLDAAGNLLYSNPQHKAVLGHSVEDARDMEDWLVRGCPDASYAEEVLSAWRETIWRKQLTSVFTLATGEGLLKEIEFRPKLLSDGSMLLSFMDVTETRRREEALQASEGKFRALFQGSRVGMALVDKNGDFFDINAALEKMLGYPRWEMRRKSLGVCVHPDDIAKKTALVQTLAAAGSGVAETELRLVRKDGSPLRVRLNASAVRDHEGNLLFAAYTVHDISALEKTSADLRDSQEQNRALLAASPDLVLLLDEAGKVVDLIPSASPALALDTKEVIEQGLEPFLPELAAQIPRLLEDTRRQKPGVVRLEFAGGGTESRMFEARLTPCGDARTVAVVTDVTDRNFASQSLKRQALVFENIDEAIILTDLKGRITDYNSAAEKLFGYQKHEVVGQPLYLLYDPENGRDFNRRISGEINAHNRWAGQTTFRHKDQSEGVCEVLYVPVEEHDSQAKSLVGISRPRNGSAGHASPISAAPIGGVSDAERTEISRVHHRVKNDLQVISSLLNLQLASLPDQIGRKMLKENQNRILAIAHIYRQLADTEDVRSIDFADYVEALGNHLGKTFNIDPALVDLRCRFSGVTIDIEKMVPLGLIVNELLSNSFQHGFPEGRAGWVSVDFSQQDGQATLVVADNGVGLPMAFDLRDPSTLGLQIVKILVEQLKGEIEIADSLDTEFQARFPFGAG